MGIVVAGLAQFGRTNGTNSAVEYICFAHAHIWLSPKMTQRTGDRVQVLVSVAYVLYYTSISLLIFSEPNVELSLLSGRFTAKGRAYSSSQPFYVVSIFVKGFVTRDGGKIPLFEIINC